MKPHEEAWRIVEIEGGRKLCFPVDDSGKELEFELTPERARLAAQAPAMARWLLEHQFGPDNGWGCLDCWRTEGETESPQGGPLYHGHERGCELLELLLAAGVLP